MCCQQLWDNADIEKYQDEPRVWQSAIKRPRARPQELFFLSTKSIVNRSDHLQRYSFSNSTTSSTSNAELYSTSQRTIQLTSDERRKRQPLLIPALGIRHKPSSFIPFPSTQSTMSHPQADASGVAQPYQQAETSGQDNEFPFYDYEASSQQFEEFEQNLVSEGLRPDSYFSENINSTATQHFSESLSTSSERSGLETRLDSTVLANSYPDIDAANNAVSQYRLNAMQWNAVVIQLDIANAIDRLERDIKTLSEKVKAEGLEAGTTTGGASELSITNNDSAPETTVLTAARRRLDDALSLLENERLRSGYLQKQVVGLAETENRKTQEAAVKWLKTEAGNIVRDSMLPASIGGKKRIASISPSDMEIRANSIAAQVAKKRKRGVSRERSASPKTVEAEDPEDCYEERPVHGSLPLLADTSNPQSLLVHRCYETSGTSYRYRIPDVVAQKIRETRGTWAQCQIFPFRENLNQSSPRISDLFDEIFGGSLSEPSFFRTGQHASAFNTFLQTHFVARAGKECSRCRAGSGPFAVCAYAYDPTLNRNARCANCLWLKDPKCTGFVSAEDGRERKRGRE
ncbi:hypothetical protein BJ508DRAFT_9819 [Ascobolus immersus RN42]|uniref:Uncharacterized protein n=1 Tax=Ascobolus immersus RN42 TaxID=1160509 RepID=A0A3N4HTK1_ASCIM|nr:hypothetical protein BJ508DRAFT_9819 [Ascobolus immersus RN42]